MCIRDRAMKLTEEGKKTKVFTKEKKKVLPMPDYFRNALKTVSYTHLRAHETVLDLVCRLLLEKKTLTKYKKNIYITMNKTQII